MFRNKNYSSYKNAKFITKRIRTTGKKIEVLKNKKACLWINYEKYLTNQNQ